MKHSILSRAAILSAFVLGLSALTLSSGCIAAAAGAGAAGVAYVMGDLTANLDASLDRSYRAAQRAVEQLEFTKVSESKDALIGVIKVHNAVNQKIKITLERTGDNLTKVTIRVDTFGDQPLSLAILDKIKSNL
jgi:hypothetical protein